MNSVFFAESAVLSKLDSVWVVFLVLIVVVVSLFALSAFKCDLGSHEKFSPKKLHPQSDARVY